MEKRIRILKVETGNKRVASDYNAQYYSWGNHPRKSDQLKFATCVILQQVPVASLFCHLILHNFKFMFYAVDPFVLKRE